MNTEISDMLAAAVNAVETVRSLSSADVDAVLVDVAARLRAESGAVLEANSLDLLSMSRQNPGYDRLLLSEARIESIASDMENVVSLPSPLGKVLGETVRPNGMKITKISVPFGVVGVIYEARPNVTADVFSLCLKSGNVCVLKGGSEAEHTNRKIVDIIASVLTKHGIAPAACTLLPSSREAAAGLLGAVGLVDVIIPRGSGSLIRFVRENARVPVIETGAGICHTYFDKAGDLSKGKAIVNNAKTRRVSVCNALDCLIVHSSRLCDLPALCEPLAGSNVIIYADPRAFASLDGKYPAELLCCADETSFGTEYLDYKMSVRVVDSLSEAISHIGKYGSRHSECIVSEDREAISRFWSSVDAACVYANVSTAFTDGAQFGFGAEIGISTQKLHARGPMALNELTTYKYLIDGDGQIRS